MTDVLQKPLIKSCDMTQEMQEHAITATQAAFEKFVIEKDMAAYIKKDFDSKYGPTWHCIVGKNFGSYVTHESKHFMYLYMGPQAVLLFKSS